MQLVQMSGAGAELEKRRCSKVVPRKSRGGSVGRLSALEVELDQQRQVVRREERRGQRSVLLHLRAKGSARGGATAAAVHTHKDTHARRVRSCFVQLPVRREVPERMAAQARAQARCSTSAVLESLDDVHGHRRRSSVSLLHAAATQVAIDALRLLMTFARSTALPCNSRSCGCMTAQIPRI
eukprot:6185031-Pleurochrysis_carterae.AAC.1